MTVKKASSKAKSQTSTNAAWLERDQRARLQVRHTSPYVLDRGQDVRLWDVEGHEFIDFMSGQVCTSIGHTDPEFTRIMMEQANRLVQTGIPFTTPQEIMLAEKLAELAPGDLSKSFFACTGSESTEIALRMAKFYTGRQEIIAIARGYHGATYGSWSITGRGGKFRMPEYGVGMAGVHFWPTPYEYRCHFCKDSRKCDLTCLEFAEEMLKETTSGYPAAIIIEPILSAGGIVVPSKEYFREVRRICDERDILMIVDEAQTAFGRTGKWFAMEHFGVVPDMMTLSKSLGGGFPLSAVMVNDKVAEGLESKGFSQISSHGGDPFLCAAGLAVIEITKKRDLVGNARKIGGYLKTELESFKERYEILGDVRGLGLMLGIEMVKDRDSLEPSPDMANGVTTRCMEKGLVLFGGLGSNVIRITPPLTLSRADVDKALDIIEDALKFASGKRSAKHRDPLV